MSYLRERIRRDGVIYPGNVLKIDSFLNHQIDPKIMREIGEAFYEHFGDRKITKILTIESSGIAPAIMAAVRFDVPMLFAKKTRPSTLKADEAYVSEVYSYTKKTTSTVVVPKDYISGDDAVLIIDDFLANGEAASGLIDIVRQAGASVAGVGICVEKSFQKGRERLDAAGIEVYSVVRIREINYERQEIVFREDH
ncbi:MAG: xanthine phosphoribosyltransferase [Peptoniphilus sp.]|nr:xanthine phosphoribosyltransferase [Peptoniphilus sp.]MDD7363170.1 xanthine phosphoribosyltransferase [Bacillota bacterium]MDY6044506.1 xanthine phosphoribosyltransferase [Peptoniphilus sp.]